MGYVPTPQDGLKQAQVGVSAVNQYLPSSTVDPGTNLYDMSEAVFNAYVNDFINTADSATHVDQYGNPIVLPEPPGTWTNAVLDVFASQLGFSRERPIDVQFAIIDKYLWNNVLRMRELNPFVPGATSRTIMPQTDPLSITETYFASGALSYTFPTISYLG